MKKNLLIPSWILIVCLGAIMNSSAQQDFGFKRYPAFRESKNLFEKNIVNDRLHDRTPLHLQAVKNGYPNASISSLIQLMDSVYFWTWDTLTAAWEPDAYGKDVNIMYDANNNRLSFEHKEWDGSAWINNSKQSSTYDLNNNRTSHLYQDWNGSAWINNSLSGYTYDINNNQTNDLYQTWNGSTWDNQYQRIYTYDLNNNRLTQLYQFWNGSSWDNASQYFNTYDANNNRVHSLYQTWNGSWEDYSQDTVTYNANNDVIYVLSQNWNGSSWDDYSQRFYTYDANNNLTYLLMQEWGGTSWENYWQHTGTFDANNNLLTDLDEMWNGLAWLNYFYWTGTYDANNFVVSEAYRAYNIMGTAVEYGDSLRYYFHTVTGIADVPADDDVITVFPNPAGNTLSVSGSLLSELNNIEIFDVTGQMVYRDYFPKGNSFMHTAIDVSNLNAGVYFVEVVCGEKVWRRKFVKG